MNMAAPELKTRRWQTFRAGMIRVLPPVCSLCGKRVDKGLPGTHPLGPTLDHKVPRSKGGRVYDPHNVALAHLACNSAKRDRVPTPTHSRPW